MSPSLKVLIGPKDTDFGIARVVKLPDGSGRGEVFDEAKRSWVPSTNPKLTVGVLSDALPVSPALAERLGLADPAEGVSDIPPAPTLGEVYPELKEAAKTLKNRQVKPELKAQSDKLVKAAVRNLNYNSVRDNPEVRLRPRMNNHSLLHANRFKPETVKALYASSLRVRQVADRWASGSPKKVKAMEASGQLLPRLKEQADLENETISNARVGGRYSDVPDSELLAMNEIPALPAD